MGIKTEFILYGDNFPVHELADELKLQKISIETKGQIRHIGPNAIESRIADCTSLLYETEYIDPIDVGVSLDVAYTALAPHVNQIKEYINKYHLTAKFVVVINLSENPIISIPAKFIHLANELCAEIQFDSYIKQNKKMFWRR